MQFGKLTQISSVNRGIGSLGIHQVYESFRLKYGNTDNQGRVFVYSLIPDHFIRATGIYDWNNFGPYFIVEDGKLVNTGVRSPAAIERKNRKPGFLIKRLTFLKPYLTTSERKKQLEKISPENLEPGIRMLIELSRMVNQTGGKLVVLYWDDEKFEAQGIKVMGPEELYERFINGVASNGVYVKRVSEIIDTDDPENYIPGDGHPGPQANKKLAQFLADSVISME